MIRAAKIVYSKPSDVIAFLSLRGQVYENGMAVVDVPEMGFEKIPVYYGIGGFFIQIPVGNEVWIQESEPDSGRWVMTGIKTIGTILDTDMLKIDMPAGDALLKFGNNQIKALNLTNKVSINDNFEVLQ